jgi:hypothetical protein
MSKTLRIVLVVAVMVGVLGYTVWGSQLQGDELTLKLNFWSLISLPVIAWLGVWWIRKAGG